MSIDNIPLQPRQRNYGIDLLRVVSMLMVVVLHVLGRGGILNAAEKLSASYEVAWFLEIVCYCAVNCYGLISGYVGVDAKFKYSNIAYIWIQVLFYTVGISAIGALASSQIYINSVVDALTPISKGFYWYFTAYFCMFFFIPLFNKAINSMGHKQLKILRITMFLIFSVLQTVIRKEILYTQRGYSALWLAALYVLGGIMKRTNFLKNVKSVFLILIFFGAVALTWAEKYVVDRINVSAGNNVESNILVSYISPTIVITGVVLVALFSKLNVKGILLKITVFLAPLSFAVYLIHVHRVSWNYLFKDRFVEYVNMHWALLPFAVVGTAGAVFAVCALIDFVRERIFALLKIKKLLTKLEERYLGKVWE